MEFLNIGPGFGYTVRGNPDVRPETSRNLIASVEWSGDRAWLRVQGFDNRFQDFIETRLVGDSTGIQVYTYGNVDDGFTRGAEIEAGLSLDAWRVEAGWSVLRAEDDESGEPFLGRPVGSAHGTLGHAVPGGPRLSVTGLHTGRTPICTGPTPVPCGVKPCCASTPAPPGGCPEGSRIVMVQAGTGGGRPDSIRRRAARRLRLSRPDRRRWT